MRNNEFNNKHINEDDRTSFASLPAGGLEAAVDKPSNFVVDLKQQFKKNKAAAWKNNFSEKLKKGGEVKKVYKKHESALSQLAFFFLFKFIAVFTFKITSFISKVVYKIIFHIFLFFQSFFLRILKAAGNAALLSAKIFAQKKQRLIVKLKKKKEKKQSLILKAKKQKLPLTHAALMQPEYLLKPSSSALLEEPAKRESIKDREAERKQVRKLTFSERFKPALNFAIILFILVLPFKALTYLGSMDFLDLKGRVLGITENAIGELTKGGSNIMDLQFSQASHSFADAGNNFLAAQDELNDINDLLFILAGFAPDKELRMAAGAPSILKAGQAASSLGNELSLAMDNLFNSKENLIIALNQFLGHGTRAIAQAKILNQELDNINANNLPAEYIDQFLYIKEKSNYLEKSLAEFIDIVNKIKIFIGENQEKRYLLVFQNNTEMRASGGFIGSYALIDLRDGAVKNIEVPKGGSYDTEAGLYEQVISPEPLHLVNPLWHFWDANWWPDWEKSAKKLAWFYEKSDGSTVDGVISFTPSVIEKLLSVIGPIDMTEEYGVVINADNFWLETQKITEAKPAQDILASEAVEGEGEAKIKAEPKKIIGDLINKILEVLPERLSKDNLINLIIGLEESLDQKQLLFYFSDKELEQKIKDLGWGGKIRQTSWDYLMVVNTNIAGGKSDRKIRQTISHTAEILEDGSIIDTVEIKREHTAVKNEPFAGVRNVNWIRVYVPIGSELIEASGFEQPDEIYFEQPGDGWKEDQDLFKENHQASIHYPSMTRVYEESLKTVFANWTMVDPGQTDIITLKYRLPFKLEKSKEPYKIIDQVADLINPEQKLLYPYAFYAQKQPGMVNSEINSILKLPDNYEIVWNYPADINVNPGGWFIKDNLLADKYWAVLLEK